MDGVAIYNLLRGRGNVVARIDGYAASIASVIAMAGDSVQMAENATFMIHNPYTIVLGSAEELRHEADVLDKLKATLITSYRRHTDLGESQISDLMDKETWLLADEAKESGFITEVINAVEDAPKAQNFDLSIYRNCPDRFRGNKKEQKPQSGGAASEELRRYHFELRHRNNVARSLTYETE